MTGWVIDALLLVTGRMTDERVTDERFIRDVDTLNFRAEGESGRVRVTSSGGPPMRIGIVGTGTVGSALSYAFTRTVSKVHTYDVLPHKRTVSSLHELFERTDGPVFVCLPTPSRSDGSCDTSLVEEVIRSAPPERTIVIKSTVAPGTCNGLARSVSGPEVVYNPEFLTERSAWEDFSTQKVFLLGTPEGGSLSAAREVANLYYRRFPGCVVLFTDSATAECVKYFANAFFTTKVVFFNEAALLCKELGLVHESVFDLLTRLVPSITPAHTQVPGWDGIPAAGGKCLPKDLAGLVQVCESLGLEGSNLFRSVQNRNREMRPEAYREKSL